MIGASSHLDKLKYQLRRLTPQRELVLRCLDVTPLHEAVPVRSNTEAESAKR
jgi:hypothetical protein